jgi:hypothetical protein
MCECGQLRWPKIGLPKTVSYEERSLGIFEEPPEDLSEPNNLPSIMGRRDRIGKYLGWHLRRQLSNGEFDTKLTEQNTEED